MTLPTPPRYIVLPHEVIEHAYSFDKPKRTLLSSYARLISLAWEAKYEHTPSMNEEEVIAFLKLSRRQYFEQKADMEVMGWLRSTHPRPGFVQFSFSRKIAEAILSAENRTDGAQIRTTAQDLLRIEEEDSLKLINTESSSSNPPSTAEVRKTALEEKTAPSTADQQWVTRMIANLNLLFDPMEYGLLEMRPAFRDLDPQFVLGWITKAYQDREKLQRGGGPIGLIVSRLNGTQYPNSFYIEKCSEILPDSYLEKVGGLVSFECDYCSQTFDTRADREAHEKAEHPYRCMECRATFKTFEAEKEHYDHTHNPDTQHTELPVFDKPMAVDESVRQPIPGSSLNAEQTWQSVLGQLQMEMPRASFDTWVRDSRVVRYDRNTLMVGVRNAYARDWLENRLESTVNRLLVGILNQGEMHVTFVVPAQEEA